MNIFENICGGQASPRRDEHVSVDDVVYGPQSSVSSYSLCFRQLAQLRCLAVLGTGNCSLITRRGQPRMLPGLHTLSLDRQTECGTDTPTLV